MDGHDVDMLVGAIGSIYRREGLSPPYHLRDSARHWLGLPFDAVTAAIEDHFERHRNLYRSGSGDGNFWMVEREIKRLWNDAHGVAEQAQPAPPRKQGVRKLYGRGGHAEVIDDREDVGGLYAPQPRLRGRTPEQIDGSSIGEDVEED